METNKLGIKGISIGVIIVILIFSFKVYGFEGSKVILTLGVLFFLPFLLILNNFDFELGEKIIFALFLSLGTYSTLVYWLGFVFGSLKMSSIISALILVGVAYLIKVIKKKHSKV